MAATEHDDDALESNEPAGDPANDAVTDDPSGGQRTSPLDAFSPIDPTGKATLVTMADPAAPQPSGAAGAQTIHANPAMTQISEPAAASAPRPAPPAAPPPSPASASPPTVQIGVSLLRSAVGLEQQVFSLQLRPERLGSVDVRLELDKNGRARASFTAEHADTLQLLQRDVHHLVSALKQAGVDADPSSLSFSLKDSDQDQPGFNRARGDSTRDGITGSATPAGQPVVAAPILSNRLYDIHA